MEQWFRDVIILSMKSATERREKIRRVMAKFGIDKYRFYDAATESTDRRINDKLVKGARGNIQSNINLFTELLQTENSKPILFFEDDVDSLLTAEAILAEFEQLFQLINSAERKPDMIHLGKCYDKCSMLQPVAGKIYSGSAPLCMHAVIIYPSAMKAFLRQKTYYNVADTVFKELFLNGTLFSWTYHPSLFYQDPHMQSSLRSRAETLALCNECRVEMAQLDWKSAVFSLRGLIIGLLIIFLLSIILIILYFWMSRRK